MIYIVRADQSYVKGISKVCSDGYRASYGETHTKEYIERVIREFYNLERVSIEVETVSKLWGGYFVAVENDEVIGAGGVA